MTRVKICGIKQKAHALAAIEAGADFIGLVFAPSQRQVTLSQAQDIAGAVKKRSEAIAVVGVFVNMPTDEVNGIANSCNLDWVQLSGDEPWEYCHHITRPLIKAVRIKEGQQPEEICADLSAGARALASQKYIYLLDSQVKSKYGGTGMTFDWSLARQVTEHFPVIIAGGLTPENVAQAIKMVSPWGVDVSSGVEVDGIKDIAKIRTFIETVRRADDSQR
jgi:phosphoribosylanthranilate isomerase